MSEFGKYHPVVNFIYFTFVIFFSVTMMHPICLMISLISCLSYCCFLYGRYKIGGFVKFIVPIFLLTALINPAFNHEGITILTYLPGGNPLTLESVIYGLCSACMLINIISWFSVYNKIMTSDKFIYLFGKFIPSISLIISMTLSFIPRFSFQLKRVLSAQKTLGRDVTTGSLLKRIKNSLIILSILITWSLENAVDTADSMHSRGYGQTGRTSFSLFVFSSKDIRALFIIFFIGLYILFGFISGAIDFGYFPYLSTFSFSLYGITVFIAYFVLCILPFVIDIMEVRKWIVLRSKI